MGFSSPAGWRLRSWGRSRLALVGIALAGPVLWAQPPPLPRAEQMRPLGLVGGISWYSTVDYYRDINKGVNDFYGNNTNPPLLVDTIDQHRVHELQAKNEWPEIARMISAAVEHLQAAGAQGIVLCSNTAHKVYPEVAAATRLPVLHITDATGQAIRRQGLKRVGLIGTIYTMEDGFYLDRLRKKFGIEALVPENAADRLELHRIIQKELALGIFKPVGKNFVLAEIEKLKRRGVDGIVLGCTEFALIIKPGDVSLPTFDTSALHSEMAVRFILGREEKTEAPASAGTKGR